MDQSTHRTRKGKLSVAFSQEASHGEENFREVVMALCSIGSRHGYGNFLLPIPVFQ